MNLTLIFCRGFKSAQKHNSLSNEKKEREKEKREREKKVFTISNFTNNYFLLFLYIENV